jgi:hypothetical protein
MSNPNDLIIVFSGNTFEASHIRIELENNGISAFLKDEFIGSIAPWHAAPGGAGAVKVAVAQRDREDALNIIRHINKSNAENG